MDPKLIQFIEEYGYQFIPDCYHPDIFIDMVHLKVADFATDKMMAVAISEQCDDPCDLILDVFNPPRNAVETFYSAGYYQPEFLSVLVEKGWKTNPSTVYSMLYEYSKPAANAVSESLTGWCVM